MRELLASGAGSFLGGLAGCLLALCLFAMITDTGNSRTPYLLPRKRKKVDDGGVKPPMEHGWR
jgi:hypothetical protein